MSRHQCLVFLPRNITGMQIFVLKFLYQAYYIVVMDIIGRINHLEKFGIKPGLERISALLSYLDHPEQAYRIIIVGGTNGKGSTCAMIESILRSAGYRTGLYTSPHLININERIMANGDYIDDNSLYGVSKQVFSIIDSHTELSDTTYFEFLTAVALLYFKSRHTDIAVLEVGMGGRFDATNATAPEISIVTNIALDHQQYLGDTIQKIAIEKAGIIRAGKAFVTTDTNPSSREVLEKECISKGGIFYGLNSEFFVSGDNANLNFYNNTHNLTNLTLSLKGRHQLYNAGAAIQAVLLMNEINAMDKEVTEDIIRHGLSHTSWQGRFEIIRRDPDLILDSAHNPAGIQVLIDAVKDYYPDPAYSVNKSNNKRVTIVFAVSKDKDWQTMVSLLSKIASTFIFTSYKGERSAKPHIMVDYLKSSCVPLPDIEVFESPAMAVKRAIDITPANGVIIVTGSIFLIGEIKKEMQS